MEQNSDSISLKIDECDKAILNASATLDTVQEALYRTKKELVELQEATRKAKYLLSRLRAEKSMLERQYWRSKS